MLIEKDSSDYSERFILTPNASEKEALFCVHEVGYQEKELSEILSYPNQDMFLIIFFIEGKAQLTRNGIKHRLSARSLLFIDCFEVDKYQIESDESCHFLYFFFNGKQARGFYNLLLSENNTTIYKTNHKMLFSSYIWQIINLCKENNKKASYMISFTISKILTELGMFCEEQKEAPKESFPPYINYIFHHIANFYDEKVTLGLLSEILDMNKTYLARQFKKYTGMTINEHLTRKRIEKAKYLLHYTDQTLDKVAEKTGFCHASHLNRAFILLEHIAPGAYREQWHSMRNLSVLGKRV